jgi:lipopolysaccharide/colanic/teichoic acid biosynthesis glycosyltransferase/carbonic anhydrase/acetyltransferase-like protein (isoleucine patch superfamily)
MRAFLVSTQEWPEKHLERREQTPSLLPLMDRPFIQHVLEQLVLQGFKLFDIVLCNYPESYKSLLMDGSRWGASCRYHLVKDPEKPYRPLQLLNLPENDPILLVHTNRLVLTNVARHFRPEGGLFPILYEYIPDTESSSFWTGWGWIPFLCRQNIPNHADETDLYRFLTAYGNGQCQRIPVSKPMNVLSHAALLDGHRAVLSKEVSSLLLTGKEIEPGIWLSRNIRLHPHARLIPPVYIGKNCSISKGVHIGPYVTVGSDCVIDQKTTIANSIVFKGSYVGEALEISNSLVNKNLLVNVRLGSEIVVREDFIIGRMSRSFGPRWWRTILTRSAAIVPLLIAWPVLLITAIYLKCTRKGPVWLKNQVLQLPAEPEEHLWKTFNLYSFLSEDAPAARTFQPCLSFSRTSMITVGWADVFLRFLPALISVASGKLSFTGVNPLTVEMVRSMPNDWRMLYLKAKPGIVTEALVNFGPSPSPEECYSAEAFYSVSSSLWYDLKLLFKYAGQLFGLIPKP